MSSRTVYKMPHGRSRKRWSGLGMRGGNRNAKEGDLHRFDIPPRETVEAKRLRETMRVKTVAKRRNKRKERTFAQQIVMQQRRDLNRERIAR